jgi:Uma2 family endonuclease
VDGVLVEKAMGLYESYLSALLIGYLRDHLRTHDVGIVLSSDGMVRLAPRLVRIPDVSLVSWSRLPGRAIPREPIPSLAPDLAVEVLSPGNTEREMERKLRDYFAAGVRLVWCLDPRARNVRVYRSPDLQEVIGEDGILDGGDVLPGFSLPLSEWLAAPGGEEIAG